jgi:hypothetical protein
MAMKFPLGFLWLYLGGASYRRPNVPPQAPKRKRIGRETSPKSDFQPFPAHGGIGAEIGRRALEYDPAVAHDIEAVGDLQRDRKLLLHQQDRNPTAGDFSEQFADGSATPLGRLGVVEQQVVGPGGK